MARGKGKPRGEGKRFAKGHKKLGGRKPGTPNKVDRDLMTAFLIAASECNETQNLVGFFLKLIKEQGPIVASGTMAMLVKQTPTMINAIANSEQNVNVRVKYTLEQLRAMSPTELAKLHDDPNMDRAISAIEPPATTH